MNLQSGVAGYGNVAQMKSTQGAQAKGSPAETESGVRPGQVLSGEVVEVSEDSVKLKLDGDRYLSARLDSSVTVEEGQSMSFEVKGDGAGIELRPLYANLTASAATEAALSQAGLNLTAANINMVNTMMEQGMPVNRDALRAMARTVALHPSADPSSVVELSKLGLPVTDENINQLENYKNFEHQIINDLTDLSEGLSELLSEADGKLAADILSLAAGEYGEEGTVSPEQPAEGEVLSENMVAAGKPPAEAGIGAFAEAKTVISEEAVRTEGEGAGTVIKEVLTEAAPEETITTAADEALNGKENAFVRGQEAPSGDAVTTGNNGQVSEKTASYDTVLKDITDKLKEAGGFEETVRELSDGDDGEGNITGAINRLYKQLLTNDPENALRKDIEKLFKTDEFKTQVKGELLKRMVLEPREVGDRDKIEELYRRINEQSSKAAEILENAGKADSHIMQSAKNVRENVHFMNDLNQMMQYVQLPLKMAGEQTHGDLYVYAKNKRQIGKDGKVSALLHLDMETLGPMDVYVAMQKNTGRVNTHFYLKDEETLDFISANIDKLDKRLSEKGYSLHSTVTTKDIKEDKGIVDAFLTAAAEEGAANTRVSRYSFDVRA